MKNFLIMTLVLFSFGGCKKDENQTFSEAAHEVDEEIVIEKISEPPEEEPLRLYAESVYEETRTFLRSVQLEPEELHLMVKEGESFFLSPEQYEDVVDPFITRDDAFRLIGDLSSEISGFVKYPDHRYDGNLIGVKRDGRYGFINVKDGFTWAIQPEYDSVRPFKEGLAAVKSDGKWGYIDTAGILIVEPEFDYVYDFYNGLSIVANGPRRFNERTWGIIDSQGGLIIDPSVPNEFKRVFSFYEPEVAMAYKDNSSVFSAVNREGTVILENLEAIGEKGGPIDPYFNFSDDSRLSVMATPKEIGKKGRVYGAFNVSGEWMITPQDDYESVYRLAKVYNATDSLLFAERNGSGWGFLNRDLEWTIAPQYDYAYGFDNGIAIAKKRGLYGAVNQNNEEIIPFQFENFQRFVNDMAAVKKDGRWGIIDRKGNYLITPQYDTLQLSTDPHQPFYAKLNGKGFFVSQSNEIIYEFEDAQTYVAFKEGIAFIYTPQGEMDYENSLQYYKCFAIDMKGQKIFPFDFYEWVRVFLA